MDEMTIYVPQTPEQFAEALELASAQELIIGKHSNSVVQSPLFNAVTALYLLTKRDTLVSIETFNDALVTIQNVEALQTLYARGKAAGYYGIAVDKETKKRYRMETPEFEAVLKEKGMVNFDRFYSGRLLFSAILPADFSFEKGSLYIVRGIMMGGELYKGGEMVATKSLVQAIVNDYDNIVAARMIDDATRIATVYNETVGLTVGIDDITENDTETMTLKELRKVAKNAKITNYEDKTKIELIEELKEKKIPIPVVKSLKEKVDENWTKTVAALEGLGPEKEDAEEESERKEQIIKIFNDFNNATARIADEYMRPTSSLMAMYLSGAKGSLTNAQRIFATTSAQFYRGGIAENNLSAGRSSIYTPRNSTNPEAYGLSRNSFLEGFTPIGYLFHSIAGREGLTNTQTSTSEAGVAFQSLIKSLENIKVTIFGDIRDNANNVISFAVPFNPQDLQPVKIVGKDVLAVVDINRMALKINVKNGFGKNGEVIPQVPVEQQRVLKLSRPEITKLIDFSRQTSTTISIKDRSGKEYRENVSYYEPIKDIKDRITTKHGVTDINLVYKGKALDDDKYLSDYISVPSNEDVMYIAANQGNVALNMNPNQIPSEFKQGEDYNALSYVDTEGNVRRIFKITANK